MTGNKLQRGEHKIFLLLLLFLGIIAVLFFYTAKKKINQTQNEVVSLNAPLNKKLSGKAVLADDAIVKIKIGEAEVMAEVVKSDAEKHTGLSGREKLDAGTGMFFVFDSSSKYSFWNKDMLFPIDIIWIKDSQVVDISENMPDFKTSPNYTVTPQAEANFVLEVNAGFVKEKNIKIGDEVGLPPAASL
ncbi:MAG TPA: DUF192 domain-containing protein [Candidatus Paceibacterota bacterium]